MFREMRRAGQALAAGDCEEILQKHGEGVLAVLGDDGYPYAVPLNYVYWDGKLVMHGARAGHKVDAMRECDKVSFCVIDEKTVVPEEYSTAYRSVIVFGRVKILTEPEEMLLYLDALGAKFTKDDAAARMAYMKPHLAGVAIYVLSPEHVSGKEGRLLAAERKRPCTSTD